jgi:hypothetical protein
MDQTAQTAADVIVVDNSTDGTPQLIRARFPGIKLVTQPRSALIPELWKAGIQQSSAEIVALTTAHFVPRHDWLGQVLKAHRCPLPAVGGAIESDASSRAVDWAVYFCRYSPYMLPFEEGFVAEIAGDNASYKRAYIERCQEAWQAGFWEPAVHAELKKAGFQLWLTPSIIISHKRSFGFLSFMKQRFRHGMQFGGERACRCSVPTRLIYLLASPAIPIVFLLRITGRVVAKRRHVGRLLMAYPILALFLMAWSFGEMLGYARGGKR